MTPTSVNERTGVQRSLIDGRLERELHFFHCDKGDLLRFGILLKFSPLVRENPDLLELYALNDAFVSKNVVIKIRKYKRMLIYIFES